MRKILGCYTSFLEMTLKYPHLYSYAKETVISLEKVMNTVNLVDLFCIPMSRQAFEELQLLAEDVSSLIAGSSEGKDHWTFIWGKDSYSVSRYYHHHFYSISIPQPMLWIWKSICIPRIKFFTWLMLNDRLNTRNILKRRKNSNKKDTTVCFVMKMLRKHLSISSLNVQLLLVDGLPWESTGQTQPAYFRK